MKKILRSFRTCWPEMLIILLCAVMLSIGIAGKKGYHMDEMLSFELANAEFNPWIVPTQPQGRLAKFVEREIRGGSFGETVSNIWGTFTDVLKNKGNSKLLSYQADVYPEPVWIERETFWKYVTVDRVDDFNYLSVYFNVKDDNHPPLHFMVLHTVSSLFQGRMEAWMGCSINLFCVLGSMLLLMRLGRMCMVILGAPDRGRLVGDGTALLYGLSAGAMSTTLLIRMYAMLTFFCVLLLLLHLKKLYAKELGLVNFEKNNKLLILATVLGFWTQYFFLFYCLPLAFFTAVYLWRNDRKKELIRYVISMVTAAVIGVAVFPFAISDVFSSGRGVEALQNLASGLSGYGERIGTFLWILGMGCGMLGILVLLLIGLAGGVRREKEQAARREIWTLLIFPPVIYFLLAAKMSPFLVDRYIMPLFPLLILALCVSAAFSLTRWVSAKSGRQVKALYVTFGLLACSQLAMPGHFDNEYLFPEYEEQEQIAAEYGELPCICVCEGQSYYKNLPEFMQYEKTLVLTLDELKNRQDDMAELNEVVVLVKDRDRLSDITLALGEYGMYPEKTVFSSDRNGGDTILLFGKGEE